MQTEYPCRPLTVGLLIQILETLPPETLVYESTWCSDKPIDRLDAEMHDGPLMVYRRDGETRLYIDDGEASHSDIDPFRWNLLVSGP